MGIKHFCVILSLLCVLQSATFAQRIRNRPQQQQQQRRQVNDPSEIDPSVQEEITRIFTTPPPRGIHVIVTPEPNVSPTTAPQTLVTDGEQCTCVPYHMCDPINNTIRKPEGDASTGINPNPSVVPSENGNGNYDYFGLIDIRFDPQDCQEVLDVCCKDDNRKEESIVPKPPSKPNRASGCGIRNVDGIDFHITGAFNNEAGFGEFPWTIAVIRIEDDACICGGSLIHPKAVLTGNHCVKDYVYKANDLKLRAGEWDTQTTKERLPYQERLASRIFGHPKFNERNLAYDVAIVELEDPFQLADHISTVCLPPPNYVASSNECFASGWGKDVFGKAGKYSVIMKRVSLPIVSFNECERALQKTRLTERFRLDPSFICAGGMPGVDTCEGDGGAPLVCPVGRREENRYAQSGIVAWGIGCKENHPAVYANVALARDWIDTQVRFIGLDTSYYTY